MANSSDRIKGIIAMGYYTGMCRGEILSLTWDKVDFAKRMIRLEPTDTKDRQARNVPICTELFEMLRERPNKLHAGDDDNHVFQFHGFKETISSQTLVNTVVPKAGLLLKA